MNQIRKNYSLFVIHYSLKSAKPILREDVGEKARKVGKRLGCWELKSDLGSSFNDHAVTRLFTADLKV